MNPASRTSSQNSPKNPPRKLSMHSCLFRNAKTQHLSASANRNVKVILAEARDRFLKGCESAETHESECQPERAGTENDICAAGSRHPGIAPVAHGDKAMPNAVPRFGGERGGGGLVEMSQTYCGRLLNPLGTFQKPRFLMIPLQIPANNGFNHGFKVVQDFIHPQ